MPYKLQASLHHFTLLISLVEKNYSHDVAKYGVMVKKEKPNYNIFNPDYLFKEFKKAY